MDFPIIINKYLALSGVCSRKESDRLLKAGKVKINGLLAEPGQMVNKGDKVEAPKKTDLIYLAYNKPRGIITHSAQEGEREISDIIKIDKKVFPLGRLDKDSYGLIILTNDGRITDRLLNPDFEHEKEYEVLVSSKITNEFIKKMSSGVLLDDGYKTKPCRVKKMGERSFSIILTEGKKRQIRRMCQSLGYHVVELARIRIMNIRLGDVRPGKWRDIKGAELEKLLGQLLPKA
jgi:23S rRNA pseudouridine2604 synthase